MTRRQEQIDAVDAARPGTVDCFHCGQPHEATPSHWGQHDNRVIWAVVCPVDDLTDYYTSEVVEVLDDDDPVPYLLTADESGSAGGALVAFVCWALTIAMIAFVLLAWFAPPKAHATRVVAGAPVIDYCPNVAGVQSVHEVVRHVWVIKVKRGHGPHAGERTCKPRRTRGGAR
jgi:hypothetical protein